MKVRKRHRLAAESTEFLRRPFTATLAEHMIEQYVLGFRSLGYTIIHRDGPGRFSRTLRTRLFLTSKWNAMSPAAQAALLAHEYVHALQWRHYRVFWLRYVASPWFRWAVECQGYREQARALRHLGAPESELRAFAKRRTWKGYGFSRRFRRAVKGQTERILLLP